MKIAVLGAGAFGTALAIALARGGERIGLWARNPDHADEIRRTEQNTRHLAGSMLPETVSVSAKIADFDAAGTFLLAMPMQQLGGFLDAHCDVLAGKAAVACAKGIDLSTGLGPTALIRRACPSATPAMLTGPSFAADIARGLPTALALACEDEAKARALQHELTAPMLRLYRTTDVRGAELGGALKNVVAIAAGVVIGAGLGDSARAARLCRDDTPCRRARRAARNACRPVGLRRSGADLHFAAIPKLPLRAGARLKPNARGWRHGRRYRDGPRRCRRGQGRQRRHAGGGYGRGTC